MDLEYENLSIFVDFNLILKSIKNLLEYQTRSFNSKINFWKAKSLLDIYVHTVIVKYG